MKIENLAELGAGAAITADLVIVGSGPAGYAIARELAGTEINVLVLESGLQEEARTFTALNRTEIDSELQSPAQKEKRVEFHSGLIPSWSSEEQPYGVRNRCLGGSTRSWAGKSAPFQTIDFEERPWVENSGWPVSAEDLAPFYDRAAALLNLGPNVHDEALFRLANIQAPEPHFDGRRLRSFFWQFARSRLDKMDVFRVAPELKRIKADNIRVLTNATATHINSDESGARVTGLDISTIDGVTSDVRAKVVVLAAGGIENPRLMLASTRADPRGVGNARDTVGRYFMDHPGVRVGHFRKEDAGKVNDRFGFYGVRDGERWQLYMHGIALADEAQREEQLVNCALYLLEDRAEDDPWDAIKSLIRLDSKNPWSDFLSAVKSPLILANGAAMTLFSTNLLPGRIKEAIINFMIARFPNLAVAMQQRRGLPHKLESLFIDVIAEQPPMRENRIVLSDKKDALGVPMARVEWKISEPERRSIISLSQKFAAAMENAGLPAPVLDDWVVNNQPEAGVIIDMAHSMGGTRMSVDPDAGVVDPDGKVHGVENLFVAGSSVFPTSSHVNPTLTIAALSIRLADHLKKTMR